jgi:hypothetical protein
MRDVRSIPFALLAGFAYSVGLSVEPESSLCERLVSHERNGRPRAVTMPHVEPGVFFTTSKA